MSDEVHKIKLAFHIVHGSYVSIYQRCLAARYFKNDNARNNKWYNKFTISKASSTITHVLILKYSLGSLELMLNKFLSRTLQVVAATNSFSKTISEMQYR